ncbi:uncharacterized protein C11orf16 homolog [Lacerta agilis]|uniref:uncharacterized protein C11orf16 homolog n=1 Tax=Lacerta agilis TaxID=80427 RepID=UPI00141A1A35|nr:uncharacterized protein C11orf16 homolog [Lacerta agilis]
MPKQGYGKIILLRCLHFGHCLHFPPLRACEAVKNLERSLDTVGIPVLARRETDGYYYPGTIIKAIIEGEKRTFLVQFAKSFGLSEDTTCVQETASSDMFECVNGMRHSILPGDKVLAPWEPQQKRYGPGTTIQGMETRDPLRGKEDEEIIVSFWNGKKAKVPLGVALWISPVQWERIVEMIHMPLTSRKASEGQLQRPGHYSGSCRAISRSMHGCAVGGLCQLQRPCCPFIFPCSRCLQHTCSFFGNSQYASCCCPKYSGCWWPPSLTEPSQRNVEEEEEFSSKPLLAVEAPPKEEPATVVSSSSSSCSSSSRSGTETGLTKTTMVDHAVNTDSSLFEKSKLQEIRRPCWKYWKRSHPSSHHNSHGTNYTLDSTCRKERSETKAVPYMDPSPTALINHSAMFETIEQSPRRQLTVKEVLGHKDTKPSSGGEQ